MLVYKYRGGNKKIFKRDLNALENNFFWGSKIDKLNDPCEALINSDKFTKQSESLEFFLGKKTKNNFIKLKEALENVLESHKKIGVFSLSEKYDDELLWAHYANSHHGFCIEYDLELLKSGYRNKVFSFPVKYSNKPPELDFKDINPTTNELIQKLVGFKSKRWEYEKEYRIIIDFAGEFFYPPIAVKAIYFGARMLDNYKEQLIKSLSGRGIKFYQIIQGEKTYQFEREPISELTDREVTYLRRFKFQGKKINLELIDTKYADIIKRGDVKLKINQLLSKNEILELSNYLRKNLFFKSDSLLIQIYQQEQEVDSLNWANSFYRNEKWEIAINDFVLKMAHHKKRSEN